MTNMPIRCYPCLYCSQI